MTEPPGMLEVGTIVRAHGIKGEVIVDLVSNRPERVRPGSRLVTTPTSAAGGRELEVLASSPHQGRFIVAFRGVDDRTTAMGMAGTTLNAEPLDEPDELWVHELVGADVVDTGTGRSHGRVVAIEANPASDLLVLEDGRLVPLRFVVAHRPGRVDVEVPAGLLDG